MEEEQKIETDSDTETAASPSQNLAKMAFKPV